MEIIRYQVLIPVTEVQVRASSAKDVDSHYLWELIHLKSTAQRRSEKVYHLSNSTSEFRNAFLKTIRQIIRESVRNMNLPPLGPPSASSPSPYGGEGGVGQAQSPPDGRVGSDDASDASVEEEEEDDSRSRGGRRPLPPPPPPHQHIISSGTASMGRAAGMNASNGGARPRPPLRAHGSGGGSLQRHSSGGDIDYDNVEACGGGGGGGSMSGGSVGGPGGSSVRARSRTMGDGMGESE